jgi:uncharacterized protein (TIGR03435 family)
MKRRRASLIIGLLFCAGAWSARASSQQQDATVQKPADDSVTFEVASVKANTSGALAGYRGIKGRSYLATNQRLRRLIADAYGIPAARVLGGPAWIGEAGTDLRFVGGDRFDVVATLPEGATAQQVPLMLRRLLVDRFKLAVHNEMRDSATYSLVMARDDGRFGPRLRRSAVDCEAAEAAGKPVPPPPAGTRGPCELEVGGEILGRGQRLSALAARLSLFADRPVVDNTGLSGGFDFDIRFPELDTPADARGGGPPNDGGGIFIALEEQLGLKLVPTRGSLEFVIVDAVERPTSN